MQGRITICVAMPEVLRLGLGQGRRTGLGMYAFVPGDCYWGSWEKGMMEGLGVYQHATGQIYEGTWRAGQKHGWGVLTTLEGHMWASERPAHSHPSGTPCPSAALPALKRLSGPFGT